MKGIYQIGQEVRGGIYAGTSELLDRNGKNLGLTFNIFAAPSDIKNNDENNLLMTFEGSLRKVQAITSLYNNYRGFNHLKEATNNDLLQNHPKGGLTDEVLYKALTSGEYEGELFIPTMQIMTENLYDNREKFSSENAFVTEYNGEDDSCCYWTCTQGNGYGTHFKSFRDGETNWIREGHSSKLSTRLVWAEPIYN